MIQSVADSVDGPSIPLSAISKSVASDAFSTLLIDFSNLPGSGAALVCLLTLLELADAELMTG